MYGKYFYNLMRRSFILAHFFVKIFRSKFIEISDSFDMSMRLLSLFCPSLLRRYDFNNFRRLKDLSLAHTEGDADLNSLKAFQTEGKSPYPSYCSWQNLEASLIDLDTSSCSSFKVAQNT